MDENTVEKLDKAMKDSFEIFKALIDILPEIFFVLDQERNVIYANNAFYERFGMDPKENVKKLPPGILLRCDNALNCSEGCGKTRKCRFCGISKAFLSSMAGSTEIHECRLLLDAKDLEADALDLRIWSRPCQATDGFYILFYIKDISHEKRRRNLERIFFHDVLNTAGQLVSLVEMVKMSGPARMTEFRDHFEEIANIFVEEIEAQRFLSAAESGELHIQPSTFDSLLFLQKMINSWNYHRLKGNRKISLAEDSCRTEISADQIVLRRILNNLVKNALEASQDSEEITLGTSSGGGMVSFTVRNPAYIPEDVQAQIFQRSFSTKGQGRGLGTYSIRLLTRRYLGGKVSFRSSQEQGTEFRIEFPAMDASAKA